MGGSKLWKWLIRTELEIDLYLFVKYHVVRDQCRAHEFQWQINCILTWNSKDTQMNIIGEKIC